MKIFRSISIVRSLLAKAVIADNTEQIANLLSLLTHLQAEYIMELEKTTCKTNLRKKVA